MKHTRILAVVLTLVLLVCAVSCGAPDGTNTRWDGLRRDGVEYTVPGTGLPREPLAYDYDVTSDPFVAAQMSLAVDLFKGVVARNDYDAGTLISPLSISMALAMAANGAQGETLDQMLSLVARDITQEQLNEGMEALRLRVLANMEPVNANLRNPPTVNIANSVWLRESDAVSFRDEFIQANKDYYDADAYERAFDESTVHEINRWVNDKTDGMIPSVVDELDDDTVMMLVNTLFFEARWHDPFSERQIKEGIFTTASGQEREVDMLSGTEYLCLDDGHAQGFMKIYEGGKYAFVALLPDAGTTVAQYVAGLEWETLLSMLRDPYAGEGIWCRYQLPKFEIAYNDGGRLDDVLQSLGMTDAYSLAKADFSGMGEMASDKDNIHIGSVMHKTAMSVDENGTRAAAVTAIYAPGAPQPIEIRNIIFDRPFVCMIIERDTGIPLFMGTVMDVQ